MLRAAKEPSRAEVLSFAAVLLVLGACLAQSTFGLWSIVASNGDNVEYRGIARVIRLGEFALPPHISQHAWGLPWMIAFVAAALHLSETAALWIISVSASLLAALLSYELYGPWPTLWFFVIDWQGIQAMSYGASEPLFTALVLAALISARKERWGLAGALAALSTGVRPIGICLVAALAIFLISRRAYRSFGYFCAVSLVVFGLYCAPMIRSGSDIFSTYHGYQTKYWRGGLPLTWPFAALLQNFTQGTNIGEPANWLLKPAFLIGHVAVIAVIVFIKPTRQRAVAHPFEIGFLLLYSAFLWTYNDGVWVLSSYPRFLFPILPIMFWAIAPHLPKRWSLVFGVGIASSAHAFAAATYHMLKLNFR